MKTFYIYDSYEVLNRICVPLAPKGAMLYNRVIQNMNNNDLYSLAYALPLYMKVGIFALVLSFLIVLMTMFCAGFTTCCVFLFLALGLMVGGCMILVNLFHTGAFNDPFNAIRLNYI